MSQPGMPSSWAMHPCNEGEWSNDFDEYENLESLVVPCPPKASGLRPTGPNEGDAADGANQGEDDEQSQFIVDGRPDGFRPGVGIASSTSSSVGGDGIRTSASTSSIGAGGVAGMAAVIAAAVAAVLAAAFLLARKRRRQQEEQQLQQGNGGISDKAKLIYLDGPSSSAGVAAGGKNAADFESDVSNILADIESFGGERLASTSTDAPRISPSSWSGDDGAIELDPKAAAAYLAGGSSATTRSTATSGAAAAAGAAAIASSATAVATTSSNKNRAARSGSNVSAASKATSAAVIASVSDSTSTATSPEDKSVPPTADGEVVDGGNEDSFISANHKDIGRRHSSVDVCVCKSATCVGCQDLSLNLGAVDFVSASKIRTDEKSSPGKVLAKLVTKGEC